MNIRIQDLSMTYPNGKQALSHLNLELKAPSMIGLLGPNGAGKSTLIKLLTAALVPSNGSIIVDGQPLLKQERLLKSHLGYLPQTFGLYEELTVYQFLDYIAALKGLSNPKAILTRVIQEVNLTEKSNARIRTLSGGQRQRVGIAQAFLGDPKLLIFDEPTVGLDPEERIHFRNLFSQAAQSVCDQLIVIHHGSILFTGAPSALIRLAAGHVGTFFEQDTSHEQGLHITSRVNTTFGVRCRGVWETLPSYAHAEEPTLEDAYLYLISKEELR